MTRKFGHRKKRRLGSAKAKHPKTLKERMDAAIAKANAKAIAKAKAKAKMPTGLMRGAIEAIIDELREKEKWSFRKRHGKTDFYEYLKDVYSRRRWAKRWAMKVAALYEIKSRENKSPIRTIIDASEEEDRQVKSRWKRAVEYAVAMKVPKSEFIEFLEKNGGVQGCADKMAALEKERAKLKRKRDRW
jgi:hypothetical protein